MTLAIRSRPRTNQNPQWNFHHRFRWIETCLLLSIISIIAQLTLDVFQLWTEWPRPGHQSSGRIKFEDAQNRSLEIQYFIYLPTNYSAEHRWPLLLYLHGAGQRGDEIRQLLTWGLPQLIANGLDVPMMVVSPQCREQVGWDSQQLLAFLDRLQERFPVDPERIYISGESMGGYGTWMLGATAPDRFAAAVPVCGSGTIKQVQELTKLPIWAFHGAKDNVVPIERSQKTTDAIEAAGGNVRLTVFKDGGHGISQLVYSRNDLYAWLLRHRRQ